MRKMILSALPWSASVLALALAGPSLAQNAPASRPQAADNQTLSEIVVTARRVEERLQDVPISITVFNQQQLDRRNIVTGVDLATYTPDLVATAHFGSNLGNYAIRGFIQEGRTTPSVGVYFAEAVAPRSGLIGSASGEGLAAGNFFDLQNVQVLKGPQGTLFGRNTTGGAILLVPQRPTDRLEGYLEASGGNLDMWRLQGVLNAPVNDKVRFRFGFDRLKRDGYLNNISGIGPDHFGEQDHIAFRASVVVDLTPKLENYTVANWSRVNEADQIPTFSGCTGAFPFGLLSCQQIARQAGHDYYTVQNSVPNANTLIRQWQVINRTSWDANDHLTVRNIASYGQYYQQISQDPFGTNWILPTSFGPIPNTGPLAGQRPVFAWSTPPTVSGLPSGPFDLLGSADQWTATEELQFVGKMRRLDWQAGGYLEISGSGQPSGAQSPILLTCSDYARLQCTDVFAGLFGLPALGSVNYAVGTSYFRNLGLYGQATYALTDQLKLTGGLRYTKDHVSATNESTTDRFFQPNVPTLFCTFPGVGPGTGTPVAAPSQCFGEAHKDSDAPTWVIDLDYKPIDSTLLYAKYSRGYRQGSVNPFAPPPFQTYNQEKVNTYEIGLKTNWRGPAPGSVNLALFYNDFTNQQLAVNLLSSTNAATPTQAILNAGASKIKGVEMDGTLSPFDRFTLSGGFSYLNTEVTEITIPTAPPGSVYDIIQPTAVKGGPISMTPKWKGTLTAAYHLPTPEELGAITVSGTLTYTDPEVLVAAPLATLPQNMLVNFNMDWVNVAGRPIDLSFFMLNALGKQYPVSVNVQTALGFTSIIPGEPRTFGVRVRYRFGQGG
jgi:iron complex outermembrane receptor protein